MKFDVRYGWGNRLLHRLAFHSGGIQVALADVESQVYSKRLADVDGSRPVFVTALPRAGTTILLNLLVKSGEFVSHTYRDMPFLLCPMLWQGLVGPFRTSDEERERAHGDGLNVSSDSPEAFEEIIWRQFWPEHYRECEIKPWTKCDDPEFVEFLHDHIRKVICLRRSVESRTPRYVSKNNLNIARLACLSKVLPDARIIVLFRDPLQHAASLLKQHLSFLDAHRQDAFVRAYMAGIGHYDFGLNLRPVNFNGWLDRDRRADATRIGFWLEYWIATYRSLLAAYSDRVRFLSHEQLTERPREALVWLSSYLGMSGGGLAAQSNALRAPRLHDVDTAVIAKEVLEESAAVYSDLCSRVDLQ